MQKNNEAWNSFFSLLKLRSEGKLSPFMRRVSPPGYWKDEATGLRRLILLVRQDRYVVDERRHVLILKDFNMAIKFAGRLRWYGKQGRLEMHYDEARNAWYASIPVEVGVEEAKTGRRSRHIVKGERRLIQIKSPKGNKAASIDLGINNLASVVVSDGTWILYKGIRAKEDYFYFMKRIAEIQSLRDTLKDKLLGDAVKELNREVRRLYGKLRRLVHLYRNFASHLLMQLIELKAQEYGIRVFEVVEYNTSRYCVYHNVEVRRHPRGVVHCPKGHKLHSDLNGALNIMKKATGKTPTVIKKPLSFIAEHNRVAPTKREVTLKTSGNPRP